MKRATAKAFYKSNNAGPIKGRCQTQEHFLQTRHVHLIVANLKIQPCGSCERIVNIRSLSTTPFELFFGKLHHAWQIIGLPFPNWWIGDRDG